MPYAQGCFAVVLHAIDHQSLRCKLRLANHDAECSKLVLQALHGLPPLVEDSLTMQLGPSLPRSLRPLQGLPPQGLPPKGLPPQGLPPQGLPPLAEGSLTTQWALSLQRSLKPPPGKHLSRLPLLALRQASGSILMPKRLFQRPPHLHSSDPPGSGQQPACLVCSIEGRCTLK